MEIVLGIDVGGSTTKIIAFSDKEKVIDSILVEARDQITSIYGAIGHLLHVNKLEIGQVSRIILTGVGAGWIEGDIYGIPTHKVTEFEAIGLGGLMLAGLQRALVVSIGTGTAFVMASREKSVHIGGSGVGGGTLIGLSRLITGHNHIESIIELARGGDLSKVDLRLSEISNVEIPSLPPDTTASNFGNVSPIASDPDKAKGLINMVFETVGMLAVFACRNTDIKDIVVTGSMTTLPQAGPLLDAVGGLGGVNFIIPERASFATAVGAASLHYSSYKKQDNTSSFGYT